MSDPKYSVEIEINEGDLLYHNDRWWEVENIEWRMGQKEAWLKPMWDDGHMMVLGPEEWQERINYTGEFRRIKEEYQNVVDF